MRGVQEDLEKSTENYYIWIMDLDFLPELLSLIPLAWAFAIMWKQRSRYGSMVPFMVGVVLLFVSRVLQVILQWPAEHLPGSLQIARSEYSAYLNGTEDFCDAIGILFLVVGFAETIRFRKTEERIIRNLEELLPLCARCKKFRTEQGEWKPIEVYIVESGGPMPTHGFCPECSAKILKEARQKGGSASPSGG